MLLNYFLIAWRNMKKNRFHAILNIVGLAIGIAFTGMIMAHVWNELQVNKELKNADRQFVIRSRWKDPNMGFDLSTSGALPKALKEQYPSLVKNYYRWDGVTLTVHGDQKDFKESVQIGDSTFLNMFGFRVMAGNAGNALSTPNSMIMTEPMAKKYFGTVNAIGRSVEIENMAGQRQPFILTAVIRTPRDNAVTDLISNYRNGIILPESSISYFGRTIDNWTNMYIVGYIELQAGVRASQLYGPIKKLLKENTPANVYENLTPDVVNVRDNYLNQNNGLVRKMLFTLSAIGLFILLMALINFINISVSRAASRMKEIGMRKVLGGKKHQLVVQFLVESMITVCISTLLAFGCYLLSAPWFEQLVGKPLPALSDFPVYFITYLLLFVILTGLAAGLYPAFVLSALPSLSSLKGSLKSVKENILLRKSLVAFQFFTAVVVLIGAFIITKQIQLFFSKGIGYEKEFVISAQVPRDWSPAGVLKMQGIRKLLAESPVIKDVSLTYEIMDGNNGGSLNIFPLGGDATSAITTFQLSTDRHFATTFQVPMAAGEYLGKEGMPVDVHKIVINAKLAKALGYPDPADAVGKQVKFAELQDAYTIGGVTKDFHFQSMQLSITPMVFLPVEVFNIYRYFAIKLKAGNMPDALEKVQQKWAQLMPGAPFEYKFMDESLAKMYKSEIQLKKTAYTATVLALVIVLLGVIGLVSLTIQKRTREMGIRKILGASVNSIIRLFIKDFMGIMIIASLLAIPVAYSLMRFWLSTYEYHIEISVMPIVIIIILLGLLTAIMIVLQTLKLAFANPVKSLNIE
ncbi:ABC transporter permease [Chitinophaga sancti]|uniref:ABC transporter permease n=1 Tax=Chitinophaga sancti TaxID=1004 RepID=A0A1K1R232_9BACT|nr:ABC transporter permease [Chitinophaga sancti]WQD64371.1 ABC transporter permease [Chitinophaga sancti]WQG90005.1 ABC transporter permease [Chitinophaga sancti]SFW65969.1 MacB-like core domain-containing protein [Chitinophaga sancti]